jgi:hypothetical protein
MGNRSTFPSMPEINPMPKMKPIVIASALMLALLCVIGLAGCAPQRAPAPNHNTSASAARVGEIMRQFQNDWQQCVDASYQVTKQQTANKNAAAELAFDSCTTEEIQMNSIYPDSAALLFPHLKNEVKRVLIQQDHLPLV